jgi:hypothetical protein
MEQSELVAAQATAAMETGAGIFAIAAQTDKAANLESIPSTYRKTKGRLGRKVV